MSNCNFKTLRTDNGGDCTYREFNKHFKTVGIRHELTVPKTLEQIRVAERLNRTFMECVRAMLTDSQLPHKFWAEPLSTVVI
uniref:Integrase catalytic domain-containing protein n=1 Tax=Amphimedon queenslandica TaxID=400682 RepID=A0A1X7TGF9_AMPQE